MPVGPLRRLVGALGLVALIPLLVMVSLGALSPVDAAPRAMVMLLVLLVLGRLVSWGMEVLAAQVESVEPAEGEPSRDAVPHHADA